MTRECEFAEWEWAPQVPSSEFADAVTQAVPLRGIGCREWLPQRPSKAFAFITAAQIVHAACQETQQMRIGMRVVRTILGDDVYTDLLGKCDAEERQNRALLLHMFLRWVQRDAFRLLDVSTFLTSDAQAARRLALDTVEHEVGGLEQRGGVAAWIALDWVQHLEDRISRRGVASPTEFRRFVRWITQRTYGIALHLGVTESDIRAVVKHAFLFFLERAIGLQENDNAFDQGRRGGAQAEETARDSSGAAGGRRR